MKKALLLCAGALAAVGLASAFGVGSSPASDVAPASETAPAPLYITGDGDFTNGTWTAAEPDEFEYVDGNYVLTVDNLSQFKISTEYGDWDTFNSGALCCDYGTEQGVEVALEPGTDNIYCPAKGSWTITVAGDLSTIKLTTEGEVVIVPIEDTPLYLRGDMNGWAADEDWRFTKLGQDSEGAWVYSYTIGETPIVMGYTFKIADADWAKVNIGGDGEPIMLDTETWVYNGGNPANLYAEEEVTGVVYLKINYADYENLIYITNDKDAPCPFPYEGYVAPDPKPEPEPEPVVGSPIENIEDLCGTYTINEDWWWPLTGDRPTTDPFFTISHIEDNLIAISCSGIDVEPIKASVNQEAGTITISTADNESLAYVEAYDEDLYLELMKINFDEEGIGQLEGTVKTITVPVLESGLINFRAAVLLWRVSVGYYYAVGNFYLTKSTVAAPYLYITGEGDFKNGPWVPEAPDKFKVVDGNYVITVNNLSEFMISTTCGNWDTFNYGAYSCDYGTEPGVEVALQPGDGIIKCPFEGNWTITVAGDLSTIILTLNETPTPPTPVDEEAIYLRGDMNAWVADEEWKLTLLGEDQEGSQIYTYVFGETGIAAGVAFKFGDAYWNKVNIGGNDGYLEINLDTVTEVFNYPAANNNMYLIEQVNGVIYLKIGTTSELFISNDKNAPCPFEYIIPEPSVEHLYITGDGDFLNGAWDPVSPGEFQFVDGKYVITVNNLSTFKISTACGDEADINEAWHIFNSGALTCNYGDLPGVKVPLVAGDANILCPVKATWTVTVAADLSSVMLTTNDPVVITPIEEIPIYLRGDMNGWEVSEEWRMTLLGKAADGTAVYSYTCGETGILTTESFKIAEETWAKINIGGDGEAIEMEVVTDAWNGGNPANFRAAEDITGVIYLQMNYDTNLGAIYFSNEKDAPCPFDYEGRPEPGAVKVNVAVSDGTSFSYKAAFGAESEFSVALADKYWQLTSYSLNGTRHEIAEPSATYDCTFIAGTRNDYEFVAEYTGKLETVENSGVVELENKVKISVYDDTVEISGLEAGVQVAVYTLGGQTIMTRTAAESEMTIRLDKGQTYVIRAGEAAVKVIL